MSSEIVNSLPLLDPEDISHLEVIHLSESLEDVKQSRIQLGRIYPLGTFQTIIGRHKKRADIRLVDNRISRAQVSMIYKNHKYFIQRLSDNTSVFLQTKSMKIDMDQLDTRFIRNGEIVHLGNPTLISFKFHDIDDDVPTEPEIFPGIKITSNGKVLINGITLSVPEHLTFRFIQKLYENLNKVVPHDELLSYLWPDDPTRIPSDLYKPAHSARKQLESLDDFEYIKTEKGYGYRLTQCPSLPKN